jgi:hypothetical protein
VSLPPLVSVADLFRVLGTLDLPPAQWGDAAQALGVELATLRAADPTAGDRDARPDPNAQAPSIPQRGPTGATPSPRRRPPRTTGVGEAQPSRLRRLEAEAVQEPLWMLTAGSLAPPGPGAADPPDPEPLLLPPWTRGILEQLVASADDRGPIDIDEAVAMLARQEPLYEVPRRARSTLSRGAQVLVDVGDGMTPYFADQLLLLAELDRVIGGHRLEVRRFAGTPARGIGAGPRRTWRPWEPPSRPRPVLLLTDLGITRPRSGRRGTASAWHRFAETARSAGCPLVALIPYPIEHVPPLLRRTMAVVTWDRTTSALDVRRATGGALRTTA